MSRKNKEIPQLPGRVFNYAEIWKGYSESSSLALDIDDRIYFLKKLFLLSPIIVISTFEFRLVEFLGLESVFEMLTNWAAAASDAGLPLESGIFTLLLILRFVVVEPLIKLCVEFWSNQKINPGYENKRRREYFLEKTFSLLRHEDQLCQDAILQHFQNMGIARSRFPEATRKRLNKVLFEKLSENVEKNNLFLQSLVKSKRNTVIMITTVGLWFTLSLLQNPKRLLTSLFTTALFPFLKEFYRYVIALPPDDEVKKSLNELKKIFQNNSFEIQQVKRLNIFSLNYTLSEFSDAEVVEFMKTQKAFRIVAIADYGILFNVESYKLLAQLKPILFDMAQKVLQQNQEPKLITENDKTSSQATASVTKSSPAVIAPVVVRASRPNIKMTRGVSVDWVELNRSVNNSKNSDSPTKITIAKPVSETYYPAWYKKFITAADAILEINTVKSDCQIFIFIKGSATEDFRLRREVKLGSDIDLFIIVLEGHTFKFPKNFKITSKFLNEHNNFLCDCEGLKIDITLRRGTLETIKTIIDDVAQKIDFLHTRFMRPYKNDINIINSRQHQECVEEQILSTKPRTAVETFTEDPFRIFRALATIFSGYYKVDLDAYLTLKNVKFCFDSTLTLPGIRIYEGLDKLFQKAHPSIVLVELKEFGWLKYFFHDAHLHYDYLLRQLFLVHARLQNTPLKNDTAIIYAVLLWYSFSRGEFYTAFASHQKRITNFFKVKFLKDKILFPSESKSSLQKCLAKSSATNDLFVIEEAQISTEKNGDVQTKLSLLFLWMSQDLRGLVVEESEGVLFDPELTAQFSCARQILLDAFSSKLPEVDIPQLIKNSIYSRSNYIEKKQKYAKIGEVRNYFAQ